MNVGNYIKKLRLSKGYSQEKLGALVGVQRAAVQKWECGKVQNLKRETIHKLADVFDVSPSSFIEDDEDFFIEGTFSKNLKKHREICGFSLGELSLRTNIPKATLHRYENGTSQKIPIDVVPILEKALNLRFGTLLGWVSDDLANVPEENITLSSSSKERTTNIGARIKARRKALNMSADELGRHLGKDRSTVFRYENGDIENFSLDTLELIARVLDTTPAYLVGWEDSKTTPEKGNTTLTPKERLLVSAYRAHPEMQSAVDTLLGIQNNAAPQPAPQKLYEGRVAAFGAGPETIYYTEEDMKNIKKAEAAYFNNKKESDS